jgi:hypothetical protein
VRVSAQSSNDLLHVTRDETMMVVVLFVDNHMIDAAAHSSAGPTDAASLCHSYSAMKEETGDCV